jgi:2,4-dienoyl-CoA reductase-like NADH-dependent reductase (Old Yellow Enzyme family)
MGLLVVEHNFVSAEGRASPRQMSIARDDDVEPHRRLLHAARRPGLRLALQISHAGSNRRDLPAGGEVGASAVPHPGSGVIPRELSTAEIAARVAAFGAAAARARAAGYDMVEIHCAHGYLLGQFLSPLTNRRGDRYGGPLANRLRLLLETIEEVRGRIGGDMPLLVRLGVSDDPPGMSLHPGGLPLADGVAAARRLDSSGIDLIDLSGGLCGSRPPGLRGEGYFRDFARAVRGAVRLPLLLTGGITRAETAEAILQAGEADLVGIGRALAADPDWVARAQRR